MAMGVPWYSSWQPQADYKFTWEEDEKQQSPQRSQTPREIPHRLSLVSPPKLSQTLQPPSVIDTAPVQEPEAVTSPPKSISIPEPPSEPHAAPKQSPSKAKAKRKGSRSSLPTKAYQVHTKHDGNSKVKSRLHNAVKISSLAAPRNRYEQAPNTNLRVFLGTHGY